MALNTPNNPWLAANMISPARHTPAITAILLFLNPISKIDAASVPVHAPVPGNGIPTKINSAQNNPFPADFCNFLPPFSPFSKHHVKNFPMIGLSLPQTKTFLAKK